MKPPRHATVVAYLALLVALSGSAYAALGKGSVGTRELKNNAVTSAKIKNAQVKTKDLANGSVTLAKLKDPGTTVLTAQVTGAGALVKGDASSVSRPSTGVYFLTFPRDVDDCSVGTTSSTFVGFDIAYDLLFFKAGIGIGNGGSADPDSLRIEVRNPDGNYVNTAFSVVVACPA